MKIFNVIYFKHIIENSLDSFFEDNIDKFRFINGQHVLSSGMSNSSLKSNLRKRIVVELNRYLVEFDIMNPRYFIIIGSCYPKNNFLLKHINKTSYFPENVRKYIEEGNIKYLIKTEGIRIDISAFNSVLEEIFDEFFTGKYIKKFFPKNVKNLFFIKDSTLDCRMMYRIIKYIYGKTNVCNLQNEFNENMKENLYSVNERINAFVKGKREMVKSEELRIKVEQIKQYLEECRSRI